MNNFKPLAASSTQSIVKQALDSQKSTVTIVGQAMAFSVAHALLHGNCKFINELFEQSPRYQKDIREMIVSINSHVIGDQKIEPEAANVFGRSTEKGFFIKEKRLDQRQYFTGETPVTNKDEQAILDLVSQFWLKTNENAAKEEKPKPSSANFIVGKLERVAKDIARNYDSDDKLAASMVQELTKIAETTMKAADYKA